MNLLLDTHVLVWWSNNDRRLSDSAMSALLDPDNILHLSVVAAWEFRWLKLYKRISVAVPLEIIVEELALVKLSFEFDLDRFSDSLPLIHGDPLDRMMIAQAMRHDLVFVTSDANIRRYPVKTIW
jgi:PIN domain nuclease of toxin-antitoxin system